MTQQLKDEIEKRIEESFRSDVWKSNPLLPAGDPHISHFLEMPSAKKGVVAYCLEPLVRFVKDELRDTLSFMVLMCSPRGEQNQPDVPISALDFAAINNLPPDPESQDRFRAVFRFIGHDAFESSSIQTTRILLQQREPELGSRSQRGRQSRRDSTSRVTFSLTGTPVPNLPIRCISVGPLIDAIRRSKVFEALRSSVGATDNQEATRKLDRLPPPDILSSLSVYFDRFFKDGTLEDDVLTWQEGEGALRTFEDLMLAFELRRSSQLRRRFLNYFAWMLLCDPHLVSYSYFGYPERQPPKAEIILAARQCPPAALLQELADQAAHAFDSLLERLSPKAAPPRTPVRRPDLEEQARKAEALFELDVAIASYLPSVLAETFGVPYGVSLAPFWRARAGEPPPLIDETLKNLDELAKNPALARVNPFLIVARPVCQYLSKELGAFRRQASTSASSAPRRLGEDTLDPSGLLSMNIVFWDLREQGFRYCSVRFVDESRAHRASFEHLLRLVDPSAHGGPDVLEGVLLMSEVLFRQSSGAVKPICLSFCGDGSPDFDPDHVLSVSPYVQFLEAPNGGFELFQKLWDYLILDRDANQEQRQSRFLEFCVSENGGVARFMGRRTQAGPAKFLGEVQHFLKAQSVEEMRSLPERAARRFLGYLTWLWLCYRDHLAYYYYIPAQLPFSERVGGFAIASEIPIPKDIIDFLFYTAAPRIVLYPALLHHRQAAGRRSQAIERCWISALPHLLVNTYGIKRIEEHAERGLDTLAENHEALNESDVNKIRERFQDIKEKVSGLWELTEDLGSMLTETGRSVRLEKLFDYCTRFSWRFAQKQNVVIADPQYENLVEPRPLVPMAALLPLWHAVLNACRAASECDTNHRSIIVCARQGAFGQSAAVEIEVVNYGTVSDAACLVRAGLEQDKDVLAALWMDEPGVRSRAFLEINVEKVSSGLAKVAVSLYVPASPATSAGSLEENTSST